MKRKDYIDWDQYFMGVAKLSALRSKDPNTQVGCCIASPENKIYSLGYNGLPRGCSDDVFSWERESGDELDTKYPYVCHSELYVTLFPCNECAKAIIQSGITEVIYEQNLYPDSIATKASLKMFKQAGVKVTEYKNKNKEIKFKV